MRFKAGLLGAALVFCAGAAPAQDKTFELRLSHWVPPSHPLQKALEDWGASIEKASNGSIKYKVYPSQQLGKAFDHYDMARDGIADFTYGHLEKFFSPSRCESDSLIAMGHGRMERASHGADGLFRC